MSLAVLAAAGLAGAPSFGAAQHTAHLAIIAAKTELNGGYNFNGYARGGMTVTVPLGWTVVIEFRNAGALTHSLEVLPYTATQAAVPPATPAFAGAATKNLSVGLPKGATTAVSFTANKPGTYEFACGVVAHAVAGMWDKFVVSATATQPGVTPPVAASFTILTR